MNPDNFTEVAFIHGWVWGFYNHNVWLITVLSLAACVILSKSFNVFQYLKFPCSQKGHNRDSAGYLTFFLIWVWLLVSEERILPSPIKKPLTGPWVIAFSWRWWENLRADISSKWERSVHQENTTRHRVMEIWGSTLSTFDLMVMWACQLQRTKWVPSELMFPSAWSRR